MLGPVGPAIVIWEAFWWAIRRGRRYDVHELARARADALGRPLCVVGAPEGGMTAGYGCGDLTVDLAGSPGCPRAVAADICGYGAIPLDDDSAVVFVSCVLEYVQDHEAAVEELLRVAGSPENLFVVRVEPWTLTSVLYPGAERVVSANGLSAVPIFSATPLPKVAHRVTNR
jgi:hypothetical protein